MIVSYDNQLLNASSISATNENINQPVTNLYHHYLELPFYSTGQSSVITIVFPTAISIDHIAYGYHNMNAMNIKFYDVLSALLDDIDVVLEENESIYYFTSIASVKTVVITVSTLAALLYIGTIFLGEYQEFPRFKQSPTGGVEFRDNDFQSAGGQTSGNRKRNLDFHGLSIDNITNQERNDFKTYYTYVQKSIPHFIDMYPDAHDEQPVFYGKIAVNNIPFDKRRISNFKYNTSVLYKESR